ncbi:putative endoglucanase type c [Rosellinia necatrix]|uniref:Putative endoglucanase type c n=1 Tax=Rosellinia necatrix TaxID=77044 RepID=A0A1W2TGC0_ROSNE|nr:putative endoglucanase type c [Rosellinia necatrix]
MADISTRTPLVPLALPPLPPLGRVPARSRISILHPGYRKGENFLFALPAVDCFIDPLSQARTWGHHHATALIAGGIIANNAFDDVYFSHDQDGRDPITTPRDGILEPGHYWLQLNSIAGGISHTPAVHSLSYTPLHKYQYPIVPSFTDWPFPHGKLPREWQQPHEPPGREDTDQVTDRCFLTDIKIGLEEAHLIPSTQLQWFNRNAMGNYCAISTANDINDPSNKMLLMANLHRAFVSPLFVIVPKPSAGSSGSGSPSISTASPTSNKLQPHAFVNHVISNVPEALDLADLYHNRSMQSKYFNLLKREFLFARFAWAVFLYLRKFTRVFTERRQFIIVDGDNHVSKWITSKEFAKLRETRGESVNRSRKRRGLSNQDREPDDEDYVHEDDEYEEGWRRRSASWESWPSDDSCDDGDEGGCQTRVSRSE